MFGLEQQISNKNKSATKSPCAWPLVKEIKNSRRVAIAVISLNHLMYLYTNTIFFLKKKKTFIFILNRKLTLSYSLATSTSNT